MPEQEIRQTLPYISRLNVTKRPTQKWVPSGYTNQEGQELSRQITELPGIECEITAYMGTVKGPAKPFRFPSKAFLELAVAEHQALPSSEETQRTIAELQSTLARTDITWAETVLASKGLPALEVLWENVFSDALDEFPAFAQPAQSINGVPVALKEMQWMADIPADGPKSIQLRTGIYLTKLVDGVRVVDYSVLPSVSTLLFEDSATRTQRLAYTSQIQDRITQLTTQLAGLPEGPSSMKTQIQAQLPQLIAEKAQRDAVTVGSLTELVANQSVQASLPLLLLAIIETACPGIDMAPIQTRMAANLAAL